MNKIDIYEFPGKEEITLELSFEPEQALSGETLTMALHAAQRIAGDDLRFFCVEVLIGTFDAELLFPITNVPEENSTYLLKGEDSQERIVCHTSWVGQQTVLLQEVDGGTLQRAIVQILADWQEGKEAGAVVLWKGIDFRGVGARICGVGGGPLKVRWMNRELDYVVEEEGDDRWVYGPMPGSSIPAPLTISLENNGAFISMRITLFWSYWTDVNLEGTRVLRSAVKRLVEEGWKIKTS